MPPLLLDLTRLMSRQGHGALTGVDRVELAWLDHMLAQPGPCWVLVRTAVGFLLLDRRGAERVARMAQGELSVATDLMSRLTRADNPAGPWEAPVLVKAAPKRPCGALRWRGSRRCFWGARCCGTCRAVWFT